jgi:cyclopropane-fatty-acyl-phospholipid synthase
MRGSVRNILDRIGNRTDICFRVVFPDGSSIQNRETDPDVTLIIKSRRAELRVLLFGHVGLLESYFDQSIDIDGDIAAAFRAAMDSGFDKGTNLLIRLRNRWHEWRFSNRSLAQAKRNAEYHYALGTDFYRLWLDHVGMMYTCAYWKEGTQSLEEAQWNKMEHVCRKIRLQPGESVADIGCGWGGFMFHAYRHHGARCSGFNVTGEQLESLRRMIRERGLGDALSVTESDFREVPGGFDKCASIGVLEHAGRDQLPETIRAMAAVLKPGGLGVLHFIGHVGLRDTEFYIRKHIFPGGWIPSLSHALSLMEENGLEILDVENLRRHYALTLDAWAERFEKHWDAIHGLDPRRFDEYFYRKWRTYLYSCAEMFRSPNSKTHLFQITFSKGNVGYDFPMSRHYLYAGDFRMPADAAAKGHD